MLRRSLSASVNFYITSVAAARPRLDPAGSVLKQVASDGSDILACFSDYEVLPLPIAEVRVCVFAGISVSSTVLTCNKRPPSQLEASPCVLFAQLLACPLPSAVDFWMSKLCKCFGSSSIPLVNASLLMRGATVAERKAMTREVRAFSSVAKPHARAANITRDENTP